ncbi:MAG TPA: hypothetical protein VGV37_25815 [Aliidongia sp.]|uniref:hypothetical protein n=1 Tax=Aliidongia sp. TaxID=1914230 RepID=UPI002DDD3C3E|nr:hypothetical protein [Aliidongia sp.]HEV2677975.1 hypothetical protein [Aliidongia sp.]
MERIFCTLCVAGLAGLLPVAGSAPALAADVAQYPTRPAAEEHCPGEVVVWVDLGTRVYYYRGQDNYGATKTGAYACQRDVKAAGFRPNRSGR